MRIKRLSNEEFDAAAVPETAEDFLNHFISGRPVGVPNWLWKGNEKHGQAKIYLMVHGMIMQMKAPEMMAGLIRIVLGTGDYFKGQPVSALNLRVASKESAQWEKALEDLSGCGVDAYDFADAVMSGAVAAKIGYRRFLETYVSICKRKGLKSPLAVTAGPPEELIDGIRQELAEIGGRREGR